MTNIDYLLVKTYQFIYLTNPGLTANIPQGATQHQILEL